MMKDLSAWAKLSLNLVCAYLLIRAVYKFIEWLRTHLLLRKLPQGPPHELLLGTMRESVSKVRITPVNCDVMMMTLTSVPTTVMLLQGFHRWHTACADTFGGFWPNRVLWLHVRGSRKISVNPLVAGTPMHECQALCHVRRLSTSQIHSYVLR